MSINRLVGERVFGWGIVAIEGELHWNTNRVTPLDKQYHATPIDSGPHFDREIAAAWEVVEHLRKTELYMESGGLRVPSWGLFLGAMEYTEPLVSFSASDAAKVICVEALRAVGIDEATIQEAYK